ncbi:MAG: tetratricopeptide repeat protein [Deltaproteobacteria bacterium]|nr:tetratricopeptide repeat protein [Deltaproteobacteria bacterium]
MIFKRLSLAFLALVLVLVLTGCLTGADQKALTQAQEMVAAGQPDRARRAFEEFIRRYPDSDLLPKALFGLASVDHLHLHRYEQALGAYRHLATLFPRDPVAPLALERMSDLYLNTLKDYPQAISILKELKANYAAQTKRGHVYQERIAWSYFLSEDYDRARAAYQLLIKEYPLSPLTEQAYVRTADTFYVQDRIAEALAAYQEALNRFPQGQLRDRVRFRMANCLEETGQLKEARKLYQELLTTYDNPEAVKIRLAGVEDRLKKGVK